MLTNNLNNRLFYPVYVHIPFFMLIEKLDLVIEKRINPEIHISGEVLDTVSDKQLSRVINALTRNNLSCTIHGPFMDLAPVAVDKKIREVTRQRLLDTLEIAAMLSPAVLVLHPGYNDLQHGDNKDNWLKNSIATWNIMVKKAEEYRLNIAIENIFDKNPLLLAKLLKEIDSPFLGHCFDVGHYNVFADYPLCDWFNIMGQYIKELHLHDNNGKRDEHLALGDGAVDIPAVFAQLKKHKITPALTIEAHNEKNVFLSLDRLKGYLI